MLVHNSCFLVPYNDWKLGGVRLDSSLSPIQLTTGRHFWTLVLQLVLVAAAFSLYERIHRRTSHDTL